MSPGLVDVHVHLNEPGRDWEGFASGTAAAAAGCLTTLVDQPLNSRPAVTSVAALRAKLAAAAAASAAGSLRVDVAFWGGLVPANAADGAALGALLDAGAVGLKAFLVPSGVDDFPAASLGDVAAALPVLASRGKPLMVHAELQLSPPGGAAAAAAAVAAGGDAAAEAGAQQQQPGDPRLHATWAASRRARSGLEGGKGRERGRERESGDTYCRSSSRAHALRHARPPPPAQPAPPPSPFFFPVSPPPPARPPEWESAAVAALLQLARPDVRLHVAHLSDAGRALGLLRAARQAGANVSAETCPHYLTWSGDEVADGQTRLKCAPPLRGARNRDALWAALLAGDVSSLGSDHSPAPADLKALDTGDFVRAWGGVASLQLALPATWVRARARWRGRRAGEGRGRARQASRSLLSARRFNAHPSPPLTRAPPPPRRRRAHARAAPRSPTSPPGGPSSRRCWPGCSGPRARLSPAATRTCACGTPTAR